MTRYKQLGHQGLYAVDPVGPPVGNPIMPKWSTANGWSVTIPAAGTFYFPLGGERYGSVVETTHQSLSLVWSAALAGTFTIEGANSAKSQTGNDMGGNDVSDYDVTGAAWQPINIAQAGMLFAVASGTGNSVAALTLTLGGTNAGGALYNLPDLGMMRLRGKLVATAGGQLRVDANSKLGS